MQKLTSIIREQNRDIYNQVYSKIANFYFNTFFPFGARQNSSRYHIFPKTKWCCIFGKNFFISWSTYSLRWTNPVRELLNVYGQLHFMPLSLKLGQTETSKKCIFQYRTKILASHFASIDLHSYNIKLTLAYHMSDWITNLNNNKIDIISYHFLIHYTQWNNYVYRLCQEPTNVLLMSIWHLDEWW